MTVMQFEHMSTVHFLALAADEHPSIVMMLTLHTVLVFLGIDKCVTCLCIFREPKTDIFCVYIYYPRSSFLIVL